MKAGLKDIKPPVLREPDPLLDDFVRRTIGAAIEVHKELGPGFGENVYANAMEFELQERKVPFEREFKVIVAYKSLVVGEGFVDFFIGSEIVVELKAVEDLAVVHTAQVLSYLKATDKKLGLLINFNVRMLRDGVKRVIRS